ncbi:hypothetical protein, partial [Klebsiella pneumoniae]
SSVVNLERYELTVPVGTRKIGITSRTAVPISVEKFQMIGTSSIKDRLEMVEANIKSKWSGKVIDVMGDSNVAYNRWQPLVAAELGCS